MYYYVVYASPSSSQPLLDKPIYVPGRRRCKLIHELRPDDADRVYNAYTDNPSHWLIHSRTACRSHASVIKHRMIYTTTDTRCMRPQPLQQSKFLFKTVL